ncbi:alpha/beta hydrolase family esterase [Nocardia sp. NPDC052566]|uniref:alpha/beta hydrolase family esterase n=1 Tax=Nocardia sp. NPDC052566 TaxID=3364330 RepID=UPI0037C98EAA
MIVAVCVCCACACTDPGTPAAPRLSPSPPAAPAPAEQPAPGDQKITLDFGGKPRTYVVHAPPTYDGHAALPLVVGLHYSNGDAAAIATMSGLNAKADTDNVLVVYPEGYQREYNALNCCGGEDDVGFVKTVVARMVSLWRADPRRIFAVGMSNGGEMAFRIAVELPATFAAIAVVSGGFIGPKTVEQSYRPATPVSVITFLGGRDRRYFAFNAGIERWQQQLACVPIGTASLAKGITVSTDICSDVSNLVVYRLPHMYHSWPGAREGELADPDAGVDATDLVWEFFRAHG